MDLTKELNKPIYGELKELARIMSGQFDKVRDISGMDYLKETALSLLFEQHLFDKDIDFSDTIKKYSCLIIITYI